MKASDIMTQNVVTIPSSLTIAQALQIMKEGGWRSLIVDRDDVDDAYGIITETDIAFKVTATGQNPHQVLVQDVMSKPCIVVNPDLSVENILKLFAQYQLLRAPVIQGELLGIVSISDILVKSHIGKQIQQKIPNQNLQNLVKQARTAYIEGGADSDQSTMTWDALEEELANLSQKRAEEVIQAALEEYFERVDG